MSNQIDYKTYYRSKAADSFKTRSKLYIFQQALLGREFNSEKVNTFLVENDLVKKYTAQYWQRNHEETIDGSSLSVGEVYNEMVRMEVAHLEELKVLRDCYIKEFFPAKFDFDEFTKICGSDHCTYCKITMSDIDTLASCLELFKKNERGWKLEMDRKNSNFEYLPENVVMACYWCNNAKTDEFTDVEFMVVGEAIGQVWKSRLNKVKNKPKL
ncbi:hypothetical protein Oweho_3270 [Owenweeksia hongkongensis DSM 17368]|uniref:Uncharacterized protein n=1 Tax=Owenweeksia hongkongensis (strain DSM 17368 / CIP 108786 / JCM 12287 / NRRL B-23963 / UST20020801) TaxID=926562 RepID=G8R4C1_OWEHD|nr:hypothetical protein [Owenweeksia hongkongensis]AEV34221.1 hypothetical protein Oweho_3270 [Owenweeksia hongkongensis DSM 17368]